MNHERPPIPMLLQQLAQVLRLCDGPRKPVEYKAVRTIRPLDALRDDLEHQRVRNQLTTLHNRLGLHSKRRAPSDMLAEHVTRREVRYRVLGGKLFRLRAFPGARRPEKNHGAIELFRGP